jgi:putative transposase
VVQRGNDRQACFREPTDYMVYLVTLRDMAVKHGCAIHAYCLMTNHVHILLTPDSVAACTGLMRDLGQRFVQYFNRRHDRTGTLWEGRFRSSLVESARYVLACYRYVELNPVRAGLVRHPADYAWSSHAVNAGLAPNTFLTPHAELSAVASNYRALFEQELEPALIRDIRQATHGGYPLAGETFKAELKKLSARRVEPGRAGRPSKESENLAAKSGSDPDLFEIGL